MNRENHEGPVVCIVEDDAAVRRSLVRLVESLGLRARAFATPGELLEWGRVSDPVNCLLLDIQLPGMSGFELYDRFVLARGGAPVIFITGDPRSDTRDRASRVDAVACLEKPFDEVALAGALRRAIDSSIESLR